MINDEEIPAKTIVSPVDQLLDKKNEKRKGIRPPPISKKIPGHSRKGTNEERAAFAQKVVEHRLNGLTFDDIASLLNCPRTTAHDAYKRAMKEYREMHLDDQKSLLAQYSARMERIYRLHLGKYAATAAPGKVGDVRILKEAAELENAAFDRLQSAGLLPKAKEAIHFTGEMDYEFRIVQKQKKSEEKPQSI